MKSICIRFRKIYRLVDFKKIWGSGLD